MNLLKRGTARDSHGRFASKGGGGRGKAPSTRSAKTTVRVSTLRTAASIHEAKAKSLGEAGKAASAASHMKRAKLMRQAVAAHTPSHSADHVVSRGRGRKFKVTSGRTVSHFKTQQDAHDFKALKEDTHGAISTEQHARLSPGKKGQYVKVHGLSGRVIGHRPRPRKVKKMDLMLKLTAARVDLSRGIVKRSFAGKKRSDLAAKGEAMPDGSYPTPTLADLNNAIQAWGRGASPALKAYLKKRAKALNASQSVLDRIDGLVVKADMFVEGEITKFDEEHRNVFGWAYVAKNAEGEVLYDKSQDFVDDATIGDLEKAAYGFVLDSRIGDEMHNWGSSSTMIESMFVTPEKMEKIGVPPGNAPTGWWVGFHVDDDGAWDRVKKGERLAFSIGGSGTREKVDENG